MIEATVVLSWIFTPADYFEAPIEVLGDAYTIRIADGKVDASLSAAAYDAEPAFRDRLREVIDVRFLGAQLETRKAYQLSGLPNVTRVHPDGRKEYSMTAEPGRFTLSGGAIDVRVTNKDGTVVVDSKRDRAAKKAALAELVAAHAADRVLALMLRSFDRSVRDPANELVHLYEIRDALVAKFGSEAGARAALKLDKKHWGTLGRLCNDEPLKQGRHRGSKPEIPLRGATDNELHEARRIARAMIEAYARSL